MEVEQNIVKVIDSYMSSTADLLDKLSMALLLIKRFLAEDNMEAVKLSWDVEPIHLETFCKAFYCQKPIQEEAVMLRKDIIEAICVVLKQKAEMASAADIETILNS